MHTPHSSGMMHTSVVVGAVINSVDWSDAYAVMDFTVGSKAMAGTRVILLISY